jgi:sulfatase maturation enzyme AslB (radical SAM superfamily)
MEKIMNKKIRPREENLKNLWAGKNERIPVNPAQYSFDSKSREEAYINAQFTTDRELELYRDYRAEWYRRAKEFDPGDFPLAVCIELVSTCNLRCSMCYTITEEFQNSVIGAQRMMPWPIVKSMIDECAELGVPSLLFSWRGESTLYKSRFEGKLYTFPDVLAYAREKGILEITCLTHGQAIDDNLAEAIVEAQPSWLSFSIDGLEESYNLIRTPPKGTINAFKTVISNIKRLVKIRDSKGLTRPQIRTNTIFPAIADDPDKYHKIMKDIGVGWVTINELRDYRDKIVPEDKLVKDWGCQYPFQRLVVSANGIMLPCTGAHDEEQGLVIGRIKGSGPKQIRNDDGEIINISMPEKTLYEAWHCKKINQIRKVHKNNNRIKINPGCRNCRHGIVKNGVEWVPEDWNSAKMDWKWD